LVALGLLDLAENRIRPLFHQSGPQPPWDTFWGTADESQNFVMAGNTAVIVHQGTLSEFNLDTSELSPLWGHRDTYGGFGGLAWARNEWHGPGRGGVAIDGDRVYWLTGSRILCLKRGDPGKQAEDVGLDGDRVPTQRAQQPTPLTTRQVGQMLAHSVAELLSRSWAPLFVDPGLAGRDFWFDDSGETFEALAWAYPHLDPDLQHRVTTRLAEEWTGHPPLTEQALYPLQEGAGREYFPVPDSLRTGSGDGNRPHRFANVYAVWLYAERCHEWDRVLSAWPRMKALLDDFLRTHWQLDGDRGDLYANRYLASLLAAERMADKAGDSAAAEQANTLAHRTADALIAWWQRAAAGGAVTASNGVAQLDRFIGNGDAISFRVAPHRHKLALLAGLSPEVAEVVRTRALAAVEKVWQTVDVLYRTWPLAGEERQVHFGENFMDPPDLSLGCFAGMAWLQSASPAELKLRLDIPFCRADLTYITKLALVLEQERPHPPSADPTAARRPATAPQARYP
jgi:hypothetical protein